MKEYIKSNNLLGFENNIKILNSLPNAGLPDEVVVLKNDGIYQYKNNVWVKLINTGDVQGANVPIGMISASTTILNDSDWLLCDGSTYDTTIYPGLYSILGSNSLPDLRGRYLVGQGQNLTDTIGNHDDKASCNVGTCHSEVFQKHSHSVPTCSHSHDLCIRFYSNGACVCDEITNAPTHSHKHHMGVGTYCDVDAADNNIICGTTGNKGCYYPIGTSCCGGITRFFCCDAWQCYVPECMIDTTPGCYRDNTSSAATAPEISTCITTLVDSAVCAPSSYLTDPFKSYTVNFYIKAK